LTNKRAKQQTATVLLFQTVSYLNLPIISILSCYIEIYFDRHLNLLQAGPHLLKVSLMPKRKRGITNHLKNTEDDWQLANSELVKLFLLLLIPNINADMKCLIWNQKLTHSSRTLCFTVMR